MKRICTCLLMILLLTGCGTAPLRVYLAMHSDEVETSTSKVTIPVRFVVEAGTPARTIGRNLRQAGLIQDDLLFEAYVRVNGLSTQLAAGTFILTPDMPIRQIVDELSRADASSVTVTIREGWRLEQVADFLASANLFSDLTDGSSAQAESYRQQALSGVLEGIDPAKYPFLQARPAGASLEGYLFPDTYLLPSVGTLASDLLQRQLDTFAQRVLPLYEAAIAAQLTQLDLHAVLTLASIVEREAVVADERPAIAGVYLNRLTQGIKLDADPTVQYAMGFQPTTGQWWKSPVFLEEYGGVISPYNTYLNPGLPPGPIASPGSSSIQAVLAPAKHNYLYFMGIGDGSGRHVFAETFAEHQVNVQKYQK